MTLMTIKNTEIMIRMTMMMVVIVRIGKGV